MENALILGSRESIIFGYENGVFEDGNTVITIERHVAAITGCRVLPEADRTPRFPLLQE